MGFAFKVYARTGTGIEDLGWNPVAYASMVQHEELIPYLLLFVELLWGLVWLSGVQP